MKQSAIAALFAVVLMQNAASAAVVWQDSGNLSPGGYYADLPFLTPGTYEFRWNSETALSDIPYSSWLENLGLQVYNFYFEDGTYYGGDEVPVGQSVDLTPAPSDDPKSFSHIFKINPLPKDYVIRYPSGAIAETDIFFGVRADINLYPVQDFGAYAASISAIPEAPTWAMMLAGFAGLGFAGRRAWARRAG